MLKRLPWLLFALALLLAAPAFAEDAEKPTVAILRFGGTSAEFTVTEAAILDALQAYGLVSAEERGDMTGRRELAGEQLNIIWGDANWELSALNLMIEAALDRGADTLLTLTTPVTQAAATLSNDMDKPATLLFASVYYPFEAGIAQATCLKPHHIAGLTIQPRYEDLLALLPMLGLEGAAIGVIFSPAETSGQIGAQIIADLAQARGYRVIEAAVMGVSDFPIAAEALVNKGAQVFLSPLDSITALGLPAIAGVADANRIPLVYPSVGAVYHGATIGMGFLHHYEQGIAAGRMLALHLLGELDPATIGIQVQSGDILSLNLDAAARQDLVIADSLLERAALLIANDETWGSPDLATANEALSINQLRETLADDDAFLESLHCTPELIAEQQAALDAQQ